MVATVPAHTAAGPSGATRHALRVLQVGAFAGVLAALPFRLFELDRYTVPKELVLHLSAAAAALLCLRAARRLTVFAVDWLLIALLGVTALSALAATNGWLAFQALGVSLSGAALFWTARAIARAGYGRPLLVALAAATVLGAATALAQAYGTVTSPLFSLVRAPGGTFGNRNFVAHLAAIGLPALLLVTLESRDRRRFALGAAGVALVAAALFLTRSRAGWLSAGLTITLFAAEWVRLRRLPRESLGRSRLMRLAAVAAVGVAAAWLLPNRLAWRSESPYLESLTSMANYKDGSGRGRLIQYGNSLAMAAAYPVLGVGPGNWPVHYPRFMAPNDPSFDADDIIPTNPWPSSDWVAIVSERGFPAVVLYGLVGLALALGAWMRQRRQDGDTRVPHDLTLLVTLVATAVVGAFDAVLLLPIPTFFAWTIVGTLTSAARPVHEIALTPVRRRWMLIAVSIVAALLVVRAAGRIAAMALYDGGGRSAKVWAARIDPGNYRIRMLLAAEERANGRCARAVPHARAARDLFPNYPAPGRLLRACGSRRQP